MATVQLGAIGRHIRNLVVDLKMGDQTDGTLLRAFLDHNDQAAFEALLRRHGPMVLRVCSRTLGNTHDAEDALQATFLVLAQRAKSIRKRESLGSWLHGVAYRMSTDARRAAGRRRGHESRANPVHPTDPALNAAWQEVQAILDEEIQHLPESLREPFVACCLENQSCAEAAQQLGVEEVAVRQRLSRARKLLQHRLTQRGVSLAAVLGMAAVTATEASAAVSRSLVNSTVIAAAKIAAGQTLAGASVPAAVLKLLEGAKRAMILTKLKTATVVSLLAVLTSFGAALLADQLSASPQEVGKEKAATDSAKAGNPSITEAPRRAGPPRVLVEYKSPLTCMAWSPDGRVVATGTEDGAIHITEAATGKEVNSFRVGATITALAFAPNGKKLVLGQPGQPGSIWDIAAGKEEPRGGGGGGGGNIPPTVHVAFTPDGQWAVTIAVGRMVRSGPMGGGAMMMGNPAGGGCAAISPDGMIGGWCDAKGMLRVLQPTQAASGPPQILQVDKTPCIAFAPGGKLLAVGGDDNSVQLWDLTAMKKTLLLTGLEKPAAQLSFSADGRTVTAVAADGMSIQIWNLSRNGARFRINPIGGAVGSHAQSPDGKMLATAAKGGKQLFLWKITSRQLTHQDPAPGLSAHDMTALWADLANPDVDKADAAWRKLGATGDGAVPFVRKQIRSIAVPAVDLKTINKLVSELDSDQYATRERATRELMAAGELAIDPLNRHLEKGVSAEAGRRIHDVLKKLGPPALTVERMRVLEAIELLEQLRTAKAIALLEETESDALIPPQIRSEARQALQRLAQSQKEKK
jgi:RNA polymerase sigma factor (sigma-70 family)